MSDPEFMTEAEARKWWAERRDAYRAVMESLPHKIASTLPPPEQRAEAERLARIELELILDALEFPGMEALRKGGQTDA